MVTDLRTRTDHLEARVRIDEALLEIAARDLAAVLTAQNRRFSATCDPVGLSRHPVREQRLVFWGVFLSCLAAGLSLLLVAVEPGSGPAWGQPAVLFFVSVGLGCTFSQLPRIRAAIFRWVDGLLSRRATRFMKPLLEKSPFEIHYRLEGAKLSSKWVKGDDTLEERQRDISAFRMAKLGSRCGALFKTRRALSPTLVFFFEDSEQRTQWENALALAGVTEGISVLDA